MTFKAATRVVAKTLEKNLPTILTATGIAGSVTAIIFTAKETPKYQKLISKKKLESGDSYRKVDAVSVIVESYWPAILTEAGAITCLILSNRISIKRTAAALAALGVAETKLADKSEAVAKLLGAKKEQQVNDKVAEKKAKEATDKPIILTGTGYMDCLDTLSGRRFKADYDKIKQAFDEINDMLDYECFVPINDLYEQWGLKPIGIGENLGWNGRGFFPEEPTYRDRVKPEFSSQLDDNGVPILVIDYSVAPKACYEEYH